MTNHPNRSVKSSRVPFTAAEAKAFELCGYASTKEIEAAYDRNSMWGFGSVCAILLRELDRRSGYDASKDVEVAFREASTLPAICS